jgi:hypothetical protein
MGVHGCTVIPLLAKNEPVVGLEDREREHAEAEAGATLIGVRGAEREAQYHVEAAAGADEERNSILYIRNAVREKVEDRQRQRRVRRA